MSTRYEKLYIGHPCNLYLCNAQLSFSIKKKDSLYSVQLSFCAKKKVYGAV